MCCLIFINQSEHTLTLPQTRFQPLLPTMFHPESESESEYFINPQGEIVQQSQNDSFKVVFNQGHYLSDSMFQICQFSSIIQLFSLINGQLKKNPSSSLLSALSPLSLSSSSMKVLVISTSSHNLMCIVDEQVGMLISEY